MKHLDFRFRRIEIDRRHPDRGRSEIDGEDPG
jgi:hypothetical protein